MSRALALVAMLGALVPGCMSYVHAVNQDELLPDPGLPVEVVREKRIWMGVNGDNAFVAEAHREFLAQCPGGTIHSVTTRLSSDNGFLHWDQRVRIAGICVAPRGS